MGERVAAARKRQGLTQTKLADQAELSVPFISEIENDKRTPGSDSLLRLADALGVSMDYLMRGDEAGRRQDVQPRSAVTIPPALGQAAEEEGWGYNDTATLLEARELILARRSGGKAAKSTDEYTKEEWKKLYGLIEV